MTQARFQTHREAVEAKWHSRRHETNAAAREAKERYQATHGKAARQRRAQERTK